MDRVVLVDPDERRARFDVARMQTRCREAVFEYPVRCEEWLKVLGAFPMVLLALNVGVRDLRMGLPCECGLEIPGAIRVENRGLRC